MMDKTIAVRLHPRLESEGRGLCDPEDPRNGEVITGRNYGPKGYIIVHPSGFIRAQIQAGTLVKVPVKKASDSKGKIRAGTAAAGSRKAGKVKS
jgi:hypothetical protein